MYRLGYGRWAPELTHEVLDGFLANLEHHEEAVGSYEQDGNTVAHAALEEQLQAAAARERRLALRRSKKG